MKVQPLDVRHHNPDAWDTSPLLESLALTSLDRALHPRAREDARNEVYAFDRGGNARLRPHRRAAVGQRHASSAAHRALPGVGRPFDTVGASMS